MVLSVLILMLEILVLILLMVLAIKPGKGIGAIKDNFKLTPQRKDSIEAVFPSWFLSLHFFYQLFSVILLFLLFLLFFMRFFTHSIIVLGFFAAPIASL